MPEQIYGIRHHGPGSARAVVHELENHPPDVLLVEGPPEADDLVRWVADAGLEPPVALLGYAADDPRRAAFWPFAVFSPEWQAIRWAVERGVPVRFFDLPFAYRLADDAKPPEPAGPAALDDQNADPAGAVEAAAGDQHTDELVAAGLDGGPAPAGPTPTGPEPTGPQATADPKRPGQKRPGRSPAGRNRLGRS